MRRILIILLLSLILYPLSSHAKSVKDPKKSLERFEAWFIEENLTKPIFITTEEKTDDDEENFINTDSEKEYINELMAQEVAKKLAQRDLLGFKKKKIFKSFNKEP